MRKRSTTIFGAIGLLALLAAGPAAAQKSKDTLRLAINDTFSVLDPYYFPQDEAGQLYRSIYETLVAYDERKHKFVPRLAKAWRRTGPTMLEFDLRDDVKFHNGNKFDADDVKHTFEYLADPKVKIRFKGRYSWVKRVDKLGPYKVRVISKKAFSTDLSTIAYRFFIYDAETHEKLADPTKYGETAVATGPYRVVSIDRSKIVMERFDGYYDKSGYYRAPIKRVIGLFIPERQTQLAQLFTGGIDLMRNVTADIAHELAGRPGFAVTPTHSGMLLYVTLDAAGRSDNKVMTDQRVRKAFMMAIDRKKLVRNIVPGGEMAALLNAICFPEDAACSVTTQPAGYNPTEAKKLLAEAGYPDGMDLVLYAFGPISQIAEAIAGEVRKVGIRAKVSPMPLSLYVKLRAQGKFTAFVGFYPTAAQPDTANLLNFFFSGSRDYWRDPIIKHADAAGSLEFDLAKRTAIYQPAMDRVNQMNYIYPVSELPIVWAHTDQVRLEENPLTPLEIRLGDFFWK